MNERDVTGKSLKYTCIHYLKDDTEGGILQAANKNISTHGELSVCLFTTTTQNI